VIVAGKEKGGSIFFEKKKQKTFENLDRVTTAEFGARI